MDLTMLNYLSRKNSGVKKNTYFDITHRNFNTLITCCFICLHFHLPHFTFSLSSWWLDLVILLPLLLSPSLPFLLHSSSSPSPYPILLLLLFPTVNNALPSMKSSHTLHKQCNKFILSKLTATVALMKLDLQH